VSSGNLVIPANIKPFTWTEDLDREQYLFATYRVTAVCSGEHAALGMAMEQSASTLNIEGYATPDMLEGYSIRIRRVTPVADETVRAAVPPYLLDTEVYLASEARGSVCFDVELAIPACLLQGKPAQLLNVVIGELPRLGFLTGFRLTGMELPAGFGPGPAFGKAGILDLLDKRQGPLLCRAMRPGVGLDTSVMARLNRDVLVAGFHLVKDDELICFASPEAYRAHLSAMIAARDDAMQATGERKLYLANLFCEPDELQERWDIANELGVDGVLIAPFIQGLGVLPALAKQRQMPILAHNSFADMLTRHGNWGIDDAAVCRWLRHLGADWFVTPGTFASEDMDSAGANRLMQAAAGEIEGVRAMMPNVQGGKHPGGLDLYRRAVGDDDFMLIVANWVDSHPDGLVAGAGEFRRALEAI
jgi:ribulose 1,5-bisphosphate carboxylase large subunit-like protein